MGDAAGWQAWATAWELAAVSLRYPDDGVVADSLVSREWSAAAEELVDALGLVPCEDWRAVLVELGSAADSDAAALARTLRVEATRLFVGAPAPAVSPYEGVWRARDEGVDPLLIINPHSVEVEKVMRACGLGRVPGTNEPLDHIATECELLECLALRAARGGACNGAQVGGGTLETARQVYARFLDEHVRVWAPRFARSLAAEARHPFYRAAGMFLEALVAAA